MIITLTGITLPGSVSAACAPPPATVSQVIAAPDKSARRIADPPFWKGDYVQGAAHRQAAAVKLPVVGVRAASSYRSIRRCVRIGSTINRLTTIFALHNSRFPAAALAEPAADGYQSRHWVGNSRG
jgi:hypothetical protein